MKKSLVALAALAATTAFAQSSVTLYGVIDVAYGAKQIEGATGVVSAGKQTGVMDGGYAGNRIGFRGTEDIGGGQAVGFVIEQGISPTNGALFGVRTATAGFALDGLAASTGKFDQGTAGGYSQSTNRQSFVSFKDNGLGEARIGYQYTTLYEISTLMGFTQTSEGVFGGSAAHTHGQAVAGGTRAMGINYISPRMNNFGLSIQTGSAAGRDTTESVTANTATGLTSDKNKRFSWKLDYAQGPWAAAYGHTSFVSAQSAKAANVAAYAVDSTGTSSVATLLNTYNVYGALTSTGGSGATANAYDTSLNQIAGSYTGSNWKVGYTRNSGTYNVTANATPNFTLAALQPTTAAFSAIGAYDIKSSRLSGMYSMGKFDVTYGSGTATVETGGAKKMDLKESQLGLLYNLSKRTKAYVYNGEWKNATVTTATGSYKGKATVAGIYHSF